MPQAALEDTPELEAIDHPSDPLLEGALRSLVASLPHRSRLVIVLRFQEDLSPAEIADVLEMPLGTVKSTLHRSLALLREKLERRQGTEKKNVEEI